MILKNVTPESISSRKEFQSSNMMLDWAGVRAMKEAGITFGSHTRTHLNLAEVPRNHKIQELLSSKSEIEGAVGEEVCFFAYPGGRFSVDVVETLRDWGYRCACSNEPGSNSLGSDPFTLKRINVWEGTVSGFRGGFSKALLAMQLVRYIR